MAPVDADVGGNRWAGTFPVDRCGPWKFSVEAWSDAFASWRDELQRKVDAGQEDLSGELSEGVVHLGAAADRARGADAERLRAARAAVADTSADWRHRAAAALDPEVAAAADRCPDRHDSTIAGPFDVHVDRERARFGSWYELFPRSWGGFRGVAEQVPRLAELGFDVLYLPPIHPIGETNRKGANNSLVAGPGDPGSPVGDRPPRRRRPRRDRPRARDARGLRPPGRRRPRARHRRRAGLRDPVLAPTTRG